RLDLLLGEAPELLAEQLVLLAEDVALHGFLLAVLVGGGRLAALAGAARGARREPWRISSPRPSRCWCRATPAGGWPVPSAWRCWWTARRTSRRSPRPSSAPSARSCCSAGTCTAACACGATRRAAAGRPSCASSSSGCAPAAGSKS